ncbi:50S ribosomal protein L31 [Neisseria bacilliformis ATCC BAA-1200]|jgi:ribosomal protein L31|uniref:Large ribosomal subunit protein bL31 n=2 Tax=Neisseria TaxID=482 RepID=F2BGF3_9NEIS|nr:50S ribosomal protein L31 [Neisseria bacilliformis ATCC BAA-1200]
MPATRKDKHMKQNIHPNYHEVKVTCSCGNQFVTQSAMEKDNFTIEVCSQCHPFYTGTQKIVDTTGRVDKFNSKFGKLFKRS